MLDNIRRHLSYANVMATLAVFIALGSSSYAVATLNGKRLTNRSVRANKIARNTLTGGEIRESRLGRVPRATNADRLGGLDASDLKIRCPGDTFPVADACVEKSPRVPAAYGTALGTCAGIGTPKGPGRRLPTHGELTAALAGPSIAPGGELTGDVFSSNSRPGEVDVLYVTDSVGHVGVTPDTFAGAKAYRCVTDPLN